MISAVLPSGAYSWNDALLDFLTGETSGPLPPALQNHPSDNAET